MSTRLSTQMVINGHTDASSMLLTEHGASCRRSNYATAYTVTWQSDLIPNIYNMLHMQ